MNHLLIQSDAQRIPLACESVHCVITSPPYYGLRDYGTATWAGGDPDCDHAPSVLPRTERSRNGLTVGLDYCAAKDPVYRDLCGKCGARRIDQQIGLEPTPDVYVAKMVEVFREVRRVLRDDGTAWVNLGDSYASSQAAGDKQFGNPEFNANRPSRALTKTPARTLAGLKPKDMVGIPWRVAFALQADGWYLRSDIIWHKPNPMPESVRDRPTKSHEYIFLLTKRERYFYDAEAVRENGAGRLDRGHTVRGRIGAQGWTGQSIEESAGRNLRSVWSITPKPFKGAHFATFPPALVERCVKAGTSERGACPECGKPWERVTEPTVEYAAKLDATRNGKDWYQRAGDGNGNTKCIGKGSNRQGGISAAYETLGFRPACICPAHQPVPCLVLDPFSGAGTTIVVANALGRHGIGCDLSYKYLRMAKRRIERPHQPEIVERDTPMPLFDLT